MSNVQKKKENSFTYLKKFKKIQKGRTKSFKALITLYKAFYLNK